jgi:hypothetical protein
MPEGGDMPAIEIPKVADLESAGLVFALLPGLLTYLVHHALTHRSEPTSAVTAVLWGLAYTLLVHAIWALATLPGSLIPTPDIVGLSITAVGLGLALASLSRSGFVFRWLRAIGVTISTNWTPWETALIESRREGIDYAVAHLKDKRSVKGGICGYSHKQKDGHLVLSPYQWLGNGAAVDWMPGYLIVDGNQIIVVETVLLDDRRTEDDRSCGAVEAEAGTELTAAV